MTPAKAWLFSLSLICALFVSSCNVVQLNATVSDPPQLGDCVFVVDIRGLAADRQLAASVAIGLLNRASGKPTAVALNAPNDWKWIADIRAGSELRNSCWVAASDSDILAYAAANGAATGVIGYNISEPWSLAPVVTMAGLRQAIPVPFTAAAHVAAAQGVQTTRFTPELVAIAGIPPRGKACLEWERLGLKLGLNALSDNSSAILDPYIGVRGLGVEVDVNGHWQDDLTASQWAWADLLPVCQHAEDTIVFQRPELLSRGFLADYVVSRQLFTFFLPAMCSPGPQQDLFQTLASAAHSSGKQLKVMGYSTENEVVADCTQHHTEISLVSDWCPNLSFYSLMAPLSDTLPQVTQAPAPDYHPDHTYIAIINSDGDNMQMENNGNRDGMEARVELCQHEASICPPLAWTMSNHLASFAPYQLRWYYEQAALTGRDTFLMGPSGYGFLHPAAIRSDSPLLSAFLSNTAEAARNLSMSAYVHWDIDGNTLLRSVAGGFPYEAGLHAESVASGDLKASVHEKSHGARQSSVVTGNSLAREAFIRRFEGSAVNTVFAPGEYNVPDWVGSIAGIHEQFRWSTAMPTAEAVERADRLARGTLGYVYKIFDVDMGELERFAQSVDGHVHIVDYRQMYDLAVQKRVHAAKQ